MSGNYQTCLDAMDGEDTPQRAEARAFMLAEYGVTICSADDPIEVDVLWAESDCENVTIKNVDRR